MKQENSQEGKQSNLNAASFIKARIETLRPKLLDLTKRNPLISTKISERSNSIVRIIDTDPEKLFESIKDRSIKIKPLPALDTDPEDEESETFQDALREALLIDPEYIEKTEQIDQESEDAADLSNSLERELKDRLRKKLGMPPRQSKQNLSLPQHARNHKISPEFDLSKIVNKAGSKGQTSSPLSHIQTLLLPKVLERRLNALYTKEKTWREETGISVLHLAYGFLEWKSNENESSQRSPLILLPVQIEKKRTKEGQRFRLQAEDEQLEANKMLAEKLRLEFNILLPEYKDQGLEEYLQEIEKQAPKNVFWKVKRWAVVGVFPSARLSMYHDLDAKNWDYAENDIVSNLFHGKATQEATPFAEEYYIDSPQIEEEVPTVIADADSSQVSAIVDVIRGKNLALEGPPGTGKSQTIVNTIAAALALGKKVLFIAEKSAALEVVRSRLEAFKLGDFILPLQASKAGKEGVYKSLRARLDMSPTKPPTELDALIDQYKQARNKIQSYLDICVSEYRQTGLTVREILSKAIILNETLESLPLEIRSTEIENTHLLTQAKMASILSQLEHTESILKDASKVSECWKNIQLTTINPYTENEIQQLAIQAEELFSSLLRQRLQLESEYNFSVDIKTAHLKKVKDCLEKTEEPIDHRALDIVNNINHPNDIESLSQFVSDLSYIQGTNDYLIKYITPPIKSDTLEKLERINRLIQKNHIFSLLPEDLSTYKAKIEEDLRFWNNIHDIFSTAVCKYKPLRKTQVKNLLLFFNKFSLLSIEAKQCLSKKELSDRQFQTFLKKQIDKASRLKEEREKIKNKFLLNLLPDSKIISQHALILSKSGVFSIFSSEYRTAKKFYQSLTKTKGFKKRISGNELESLASWKNDMDEFCNNDVLANFFGLTFDGLDTEIDSYEEAFTFLGFINDHCVNFAYESVMELLLSQGELISEKITNTVQVEDLSSIKPILIKDLTQHVQQLTEKQKEITSDIEEIQALQETIFISPNLPIEKMAELNDTLRKMTARIQSIRLADKVRKLVGEHFEAERTDKKSLEAAIPLANNLLGLNKTDIKNFTNAIRANSRKSLLASIHAVLQAQTQAEDALVKLSDKTSTSYNDFFSHASTEKTLDWLRQASKDKNGLHFYPQLNSYKVELQKTGYGNIINKILDHNLPEVKDTFKALVVKSWAQGIYSLYGRELTHLKGSQLNKLRKELREADHKIIKLSRDRLQAELYKNAAPPIGTSYGRKSAYTELSLIKHETSKKQRFIPIRKLTNQASNALLELKPCWMMSPLAVAQYLAPGKVSFDLVIIDEASQMKPEDAIGALLRAKQTMVVGDTNQLPPTEFFRKVLDDEEADEDEKVTEESILEMANSTFTPRRRLRWHYRSKDPSLIEFSNKHIYGNNLVIFPAANDNHPDTGVSCIKVNGLYSSGINHEEAKAMVKSIIQFMQIHPEKSLGIVLLNQKQRDLLLEKLNYAADQRPEVKSYLDKWETKKEGLESFFIKNLENVQGDERDVIFIGTVYGPEKEGGPVMNRFGPINGTAGKRRLNVLFSRAKERIVTFTSMDPSDIRAQEDGNPGTYMLKCWLEYSATNILEAGTDTNKDPDSEFEELVIEKIKSIGCEAVPQVGVVGYCIDIGIKHPDWPHGFIMGVECDGATYHSALSARDRDRLRQEVLEGLGWNLYRIWSTDWFEDPVHETEKLRAAIVKRLAHLKAKLSQETANLQADFAPMDLFATEN